MCKPHSPRTCVQPRQPRLCRNLLDFYLPYLSYLKGQRPLATSFPPVRLRPRGYYSRRPMPMPMLAPACCPNQPSPLSSAPFPEHRLTCLLQPRRVRKFQPISCHPMRLLPTRWVGEVCACTIAPYPSLTSNSSMLNRSLGRRAAPTHGRQERKRKPLLAIHQAGGVGQLSISANLRAYCLSAKMTGVQAPPLNLRWPRC